MPEYKVRLTNIHYYETTITADTEDDAWAIAETIDYDFLEKAGDAYETDTDGFTVEEVDEVLLLMKYSVTEVTEITKKDR